MSKLQQRPLFSVPCVIALLAFLLGCSKTALQNRIAVRDIPDTMYEVYVYRFMNDMYAVLLDIPDDGKRVYMQHTGQTKRVDRDRPGAYIAEFERRVGGFRSVIKIMDNEGVERGYLMISPTLSYSVRRQVDDIVVYIWYPYSR